MRQPWHPYAIEMAGFAARHGAVDVWRIALDRVSDDVADSLSDEERRRADGFARPELRRRFVCGRAVLRSILADILGAATPSHARRLRLGRGPAGKPFLCDDPGLHFNVSHARDIAVIAATRAGAVGIDIEQQRPVPDIAGITRLVFNAAERSAMLACPGSAREALFYRTWTRKEALLKAMGIGLAGLSDPEMPSLAQAGRIWRLSMLPDLPGHVAALARPHAARGLRLWSWPA